MDKGAGLFWIGTASLLAVASLVALKGAQPLAPELAAPLSRPVQQRPASPVVAAPSYQGGERSAQLGAVHATERAWEARVEAFRRQQQLAGAGARTPAELAEAHARLRDSHFSKDEQILLDTYLATTVPVLTRQ